MAKRFLTLFFLITGWNSLAQDRYCPNPFELHQDNPNSLYEDSEQFEHWLKQKMLENTSLSRDGRTAEQIITLPVVVHVIHNGQEIGEGVNISEAQILSQIEVLNEDFRRLNSDTVDTPVQFQPVAADAGIEFILARRDPDGLPTNGITRNVGPLTSYSTSTAIDLAEVVSWPPDEYINIWVAPLSGALLGFAQFPISDLDGLSTSQLGSDFTNNPSTDGIVIGPQFFGASENGDFPILSNTFNLGRTTTHEIGHYLGLRHIWGDISNCSAPDFCVLESYKFFCDRLEGKFLQHPRLYRFLS